MIVKPGVECQAESVNRVKGEQAVPYKAQKIMQEGIVAIGWRTLCHNPVLQVSADELCVQQKTETLHYLTL